MCFQEDLERQLAQQREETEKGVDVLRKVMNKSAEMREEAHSYNEKVEQMQRKLTESEEQLKRTKEELEKCQREKQSAEQEVCFLLEIVVNECSFAEVKTRTASSTSTGGGSEAEQGDKRKRYMLAHASPASESTLLVCSHRILESNTDRAAIAKKYSAGGACNATAAIEQRAIGEK